VFFDSSIRGPSEGEALKQRPICQEVPGFMRLVIEYIGHGPRGFDMVSVAHYGEQNGDAMRDPEIMFEIAVDAQGEWTWHPVAIQQDYVGSYREAVYVGEDGQVYVRTAEVRDIQAFARVWDANLKAQGFVDAARAKFTGGSNGMGKALLQVPIA
jgi:hypothetical protein